LTILKTLTKNKDSGLLPPILGAPHPPSIRQHLQSKFHRPQPRSCKDHAKEEREKQDSIAVLLLLAEQNEELCVVLWEMIGALGA
jgi:hypothetical protein